MLWHTVGKICDKKKSSKISPQPKVSLHYLVKYELSKMLEPKHGNRKLRAHELRKM